MKFSSGFNAIMALLILIAGFSCVGAQPDLVTDTITTALSPEIKPLLVLTAMQRVADWQLAHPAKYKPTDWTQGAGYAGFMALAGISGDAKYRDAMLAVAESNQWQLGPRQYVADDHCVGQLYTELYFLYRDPKMLAPMRERFDSILANPLAPGTSSLDFSQPGHARDLWSWCDSLFMGPPTWMRLYAATDDTRYMDFAVTNWWRTTDYLYDTNAHLFYRDSTYFDKREANGQKVFWGRGNGWVMAGLVRTLQYLPMNHPDRPRFEQLFKDMADAVAACQQPDGLWHSSLLDPTNYPDKETSGSGLFTYALAWGINQGLLDHTKFQPIVEKAWTGLVGCVDADGKLTHVQAIGSDPKSFPADSTDVYGTGGFLLAGSEVYRMAVLEKSKSIKDVVFKDPNGTPGRLPIIITNPSSFRRDCETIELMTGEFARSGTSFMDILQENASQLAIMDGVSSRILDSQLVTYSLKSPRDATRNIAEQLLFQVDLAPGETRTYYVLDASTLAAVPPPIVKTFARYVPERHDDFAWESDRTAHRTYGKALETWKAEPLTSSGMDVWSKRDRSLVINKMYRENDNYNQSKPSQDDFKVGKTRGDGGLGIWQDGKLYASSNWRNYKVITTGPIRSEFELTYDAWDVNGRKVSETKRISIDAGANMSRMESTFASDDKSPLKIGVGLAERPGDNVILKESSEVTKDSTSMEIDSWTNTTARGLLVQNQDEGWMAYWQPQDFYKGTIGDAIVLPKGSVEIFTNDRPDLPANVAAPTNTITEGQPAIRNFLAIAPAEIGKPFVYYMGAGWSLSGDFTNAAEWDSYARRFAERRDEPLQVKVGN
ncbi:MAG TPA: glycoside hydrolase family 88 protein [Verrucomicrobiae bacterium]